MGFMVICLLYCTIVDADGRLTGPDAVKFFSRSQLSRGDLKQVLWLLFLGTKERERERESTQTDSKKEGKEGRKKKEYGGCSSLSLCARCCFV